MKNIKIIFLLSVFSFCASNAFAVAPLSSGYYVEFNGGLTNITNTSYGAGTSVSSGGGQGVNFNLGYKFMPFLAAEGGYTKYGQNKIKLPGVTNSTAENSAIDLAGKAILPLGDTGTELFTKLGVARVSSKITGNATKYSPGTYSATNYYFGLGAAYYCTPCFSFIAQWAQARGNSTTGASNLYSIGLSYLFGNGFV